MFPDTQDCYVPLFMVTIALCLTSNNYRFINAVNRQSSCTHNNGPLPGKVMVGRQRLPAFPIHVHDIQQHHDSCPLELFTWHKRVLIQSMYGRRELKNTAAHIRCTCIPGPYLRQIHAELRSGKKLILLLCLSLRSSTFLCLSITWTKNIIVLSPSPLN